MSCVRLTYLPGITGHLASACWKILKLVVKENARGLVISFNMPFLIFTHFTAVSSIFLNLVQELYLHKDIDACANMYLRIYLYVHGKQRIKAVLETPLILHSSLLSLSFMFPVFSFC